MGHETDQSWIWLCPMWFFPVVWLPLEDAEAYSAGWDWPWEAKCQTGSMKPDEDWHTLPSQPSETSVRPSKEDDVNVWRAVGQGKFVAHTLSTSPVAVNNSFDIFTDDEDHENDEPISQEPNYLAEAKRISGQRRKAGSAQPGEDFDEIMLEASNYNCNSQEEEMADGNKWNSQDCGQAGCDGTRGGRAAPGLTKALPNQPAAERHEHGGGFQLLWAGGKLHAKAVPGSFQHMQLHLWVHEGLATLVADGFDVDPGKLASWSGAAVADAEQVARVLLSASST